ncbi:MAG: tetratricopeptide repeat protein [Ignavibacterium sp.]|nr:MAG: tetratricopeptide repeat protein [Ignavibacterium sp.]
MKFKSIYLYGILFIIVVLFLIVVSNQSGTNNVVEKPVSGEGNIPDDSIHKPLVSGEQPSKENVSEEFRNRVDKLKSAIEENPNDTTSLKQYADLLTAAHMSEEAIEYYNRILQIDPERIDILFSVSFLYYSRGDIKNAKESTTKILILDPDNVNALYNLGAISAKNGETEKAREIWIKLAEQYPDEDISIRARNSIEKL